MIIRLTTVTQPNHQEMLALESHMVDMLYPLEGTVWEPLIMRSDAINLTEDPLMLTTIRLTSLMTNIWTFILPHLTIDTTTTIPLLQVTDVLQVVCSSTRKTTQEGRQITTECTGSKLYCFILLCVCGKGAFLNEAYLPDSI